MKTEKYPSNPYTPVTIYMTMAQFEKMDLYIGKSFAFRTFQDFVRTAVVWELNEMKRISRGYMEI